MKTMENLMSNTDEISHAVARSVKPAGDSLSGALDKAGDAAAPVLKTMADVAHQAGEVLDHSRAQLRDAQTSVSKACRGYVREQPLTSLGIAVSVGFALSWLLRRR